MYNFFKIWARLALFFYSRKTVANFALILNLNQPKILASNHPNSFFDAIVIAVHYPKPIYFLARGDAFNKPLIKKFLNALHLIPIYRLSEGKENLSKNDSTFERCLKLLKSNEHILIFPEGVCVNEWNLRSLKKGTARLAFMALHQKINNLIVQPINLNYSSFYKVPKEIIINFNEPITVSNLSNHAENVFYRIFNQELKEGITRKMLIKSDLQYFDLFPKKENYLRKILLFIPAILGFISQYWIYFFLKKWVIKKTKNSVFYDSVLFGLLMFSYPVIIIVMATFVGIFFNFNLGLSMLILLPFTAWCCKEIK